MSEGRVFPSPARGGQGCAAAGVGGGKSERGDSDPSRAGSTAPLSPAQSSTSTPPTPGPSPRGGGEGAWPHLSGVYADGVHRLPVRVYYEDTDFSGIVYHANYLRFLERGRTDLLRHAGVDQSSLHAEGEGLVFAVRRLTIDYLKPARMDDVLLVETRTADVRGASLVVAQRILRGEEVVVTAEVRVAVVANGRPARIPDHLRVLLTQGREGSC